MILPQIRTRNKVRDAKICRLWAEDLKTTEELGEQFSLSQRHIRTILYKNKDFLNFDIDWNKKKRIRNLLKWISKAKDPEANKLILQNELRIELEGNKQINIDNSQHYHFTAEHLSAARQRISTNRIDHIMSDTNSISLITTQTTKKDQNIKPNEINDK